MGGEAADDVKTEPMAGLRNVAPPPFLTKTFNMVEDPKTDEVVSWSAAGNSFVVWDVDRFSTILLPANFNHTSFTSFAHRLYLYGFRKINRKRWEFANPEFLSGKRYLLKGIKRRQSLKTGEKCEVERLREERNRLVVEIIKTWEKERSVKAQVFAMKNRIEVLDMQQKVLVFFVATLKVSSLVHQQVTETGGRKKRRLSEPAETTSAAIDSDVSKCSLGANGDGDFWAEPAEATSAVIDSDVSKCSLGATGDGDGDFWAEPAEATSAIIDSDVSRAGLGTTEEGDFWADNFDDLIEELLGDGEEIEVPVVLLES